ncbi:MAG: serine protein kinase RIO [Candidatus Micrarchaeales archaeon]|jgi:RIO kinase 1
MTIRSKKKQPSKEKHLLKEQLKIEEGIFDTRTMFRLGKLFASGVVTSMRFIMARGKEADVYLADAGSKIGKEFVVLKIFRMENSRFQDRMRYINGDPRFGRIKANIYAIVNEWCKKEYGNLLVAEAAGVHAPMPYAFNGNVLALEFIGKEGYPSRRLEQEKVNEPEKVLKTILEDVKKLYENELVHADLSEYNILMLGELPYMIDFGQAVHIKHPEAHEFLRRDIRNILHHFSKKYGVEKNEETVFRYITGASIAESGDHSP